MLRQGPDVQHLAGVVPFVQRLAGVNALVALQPDQLPAEDRRENLSRLGLAHADFTFEQHGTLQRQRDEQGGGQAPVGQVAAVPQDRGQLADATGKPRLARVTRWAEPEGIVRHGSARGVRGTEHEVLQARAGGQLALPLEPAAPCGPEILVGAVESDVLHVLAGLAVSVVAERLVQVGTALALCAPYLAQDLKGLDWLRRTRVPPAVNWSDPTLMRTGGPGDRGLRLLLFGPFPPARSLRTGETPDDADSGPGLRLDVKRP